MSEADLDRLIASWAANHAPQLIARAQADALDAARARLQARLVEALLDAADARLGAAAEEEQREVPSRSSAPVLWLYGVVSSRLAAAPAVSGVDGHAVTLHRRADLTALVSEVPRERFDRDALTARLEDLGSLEVLARAHEAVLESAMAQGAVVPFRLCTIYSSPDGLDAMLDREHATLTAALDRLDGMQEWGVKAFLRAAAVPAVAEPGTAASGTEYLSRKRERRDADEAGREATEAVVAEVHARLAERAAAAQLGRPQDRRLSGRDAEMVLNAAYLIPADGIDAFRASVDELGRRHEPDGIELELTGPWPPYHFVETPES